MDPLTHGLLGATLGQALFGRFLGRRGVMVGALVAMAPDVDVVMSGTGPMAEWLYHRGVTHAIWSAPVVGALIGAAIGFRDRAQRGRLALLSILALLSHSLLDWCTTYGIQLLAPFSNRRFALDAVAIVDPFYSLLFVIALAVGLGCGWGSRPARAAGLGILALSAAYLAYGLALNRQAESFARRQLATEGVSTADVRAYPTLLQLWLRRLVARDGEEMRVGWLSLWSPRPVAWQRFTDRRDALAAATRATEEGRIFEWFAMGQTAASVHSSAGATEVDIDDLRFGFPARPQQGIWGIRARFDETGRIEGRPVRINRPLPPVRALVAEIWRETFAAAP